MRLRMLPLRITAATTAATLALPLLLLLLFPRRSAKGIDRLLPVAALMQSFSVRPGEPPPPAWQQRLSPDQASTLWSQQRRRWWQRRRRWQRQWQRSSGSGDSQIHSQSKIYFEPLLDN